jgi:lipoyl-dependent peroxiredoxin
MKRNATANWNGTGKEGKGTLTTQTGVLSKVPYNAVSRFGEGKDTNPEELLAAAHAGCFSMKLAFVMDEAGVTDKQIETTCTITLSDGVITESHLEVKVTATGIDQAKFDSCVADAKANCPVSRLYNTNITAIASLN